MQHSQAQTTSTSGSQVLGDTSLNTNSSGDTLTHRDHSEDSIAVSFRYFDSSSIHRIDSSINDFDKIMPAPFTYSDMGVAATPAKSLLFRPFMQPGFDAGFHAMDVYKMTLKDTRFYTTSKPLTSLEYIMGSNSEQIIDFSHTQNRNKNVNIGIEFHLNSDPGAYRSQNSNTSNLRFNISSQSKDKRYSMNLIIINNTMKASANGGIVSDSALENNSLGDTYSVATRLASSSSSTRNPFKMTVTTGNIFNDKTIYYRHSYDFGQKDSIMKNDSVVTRLFYPRMRLEHVLKYSTSDNQFIDANPVSSDYLKYYDLVVPSDTFRFRDRWKDITNEFAVYTYPDKKNQSQFLKLYAGYQFLAGKFGNLASYPFNNTYVGADYRNRTRNRLWDMVLSGKLFTTGDYAGNFSAFASLKRFLPGIGSLQLEGESVNRTPSFIYKSASSGYLSYSTSSTSDTYVPHSNFPITGNTSWKNESITHASARLTIDKLNLSLEGNYYLYTNYTYFDGLFSAKQYNSVFNLLEVGAVKETNINKHFKWYVEAYLQKKAGGAPLNVPLFLIRNRLTYENNFFKNLYVATGLSVRYYSAYYADSYSPFTGQFYYQTATKISNRPDINYFVNFRILRFRFFSELSNINTAIFNKYNYRAPLAPTGGLWFRFGFKWMFIN